MIRRSKVRSDESVKPKRNLEEVKQFVEYVKNLPNPNAEKVERLKKEIKNEKYNKEMTLKLVEKVL